MTAPLLAPAARGLAVGVPGWIMAVGAMFSVQLGASLSVGLMDRIGAGGTAWLRLSFGALVFLVLARPTLRFLRRLSRRDLLLVGVLGIATAVQTIAFLAAIARIPLGTAVSIEFLGPLTVAALHARRPRAFLWPALALLGVVLLSRPWTGSFDPVGVGLAALAAVGWGFYVHLTEKVGARFEGLSGLALTVPVAAVVTAVLGVPQAWGGIDLHVLLVAAGLALLLPVLPYALEMVALRRMSPLAFGTLMALEPAFGALLGLAVLLQVPTVFQVLGVTIVVVAGILAQRADTKAVAFREPETAAPVAPG
ncbi:EamA family transporter [Brevibacterium litoralis]|uniref:EamA family transporter n=1 Tax=Brevibacterium litoralis TaxID=3138935 RepID=UPI0032F01E8C